MIDVQAKRVVVVQDPEGAFAVRRTAKDNPEPWQAEALEAVGKHDRVSIRSGHGVGK
jgi:hypothetical protein